MDFSNQKVLFQNLSEKTVMNSLYKEIVNLDTEMNNPISENIDIADTLSILKIINEEDQKVAIAVKNEIQFIAKAVDLISSSFLNNGRLFYFGAGTSGRLGVVDASECPPTFGTNPDMVRGIIAGGAQAMFKAQEGAEDNPNGAAIEFDKYNINSTDIVCGIAASGRTPYVIGALKIAKSRNIKTIMITTISRKNARKIEEYADVLICPHVGAEVIAGSTRMKSGTAQKLVLNMLTSASMIKIGKTYGNIMVDLQLTNEKLKERAKKIIIEICGCDYEKASQLLAQAKGNVKTAIMMEFGGIDYNSASQLLIENNGIIKKAISSLKK
jgi:N-acetylmuramic acid 6-phosphate etherase